MAQTRTTKPVLYAKRIELNLRTPISLAQKSLFPVHFDRTNLLRPGPWRGGGKRGVEVVHGFAASHGGCGDGIYIYKPISLNGVV